VNGISMRGKGWGGLNVSRLYSGIFIIYVGWVLPSSPLLSSKVVEILFVMLGVSVPQKKLDAFLDVVGRVSGGVENRWSYWDLAQELTLW